MTRRRCFGPFVVRPELQQVRYRTVSCTAVSDQSTTTRRDVATAVVNLSETSACVHC